MASISEPNAKFDQRVYGWVAVPQWPVRWFCLTTEWSHLIADEQTPPMQLWRIMPSGQKSFAALD